MPGIALPESFPSFHPSVLLSFTSALGKEKGEEKEGGEGVEEKEEKERGEGKEKKGEEKEGIRGERRVQKKGWRRKDGRRRDGRRRDGEERASIIPRKPVSKVNLSLSSYRVPLRS